MFVAMRYIGSLGQKWTMIFCRKIFMSQVPQAAHPPAVKVAEVGEVTGQHVSGILGQDVFVDVARGVVIVV